MSEYESRLDQELISILQSRPTAALGTLQDDGAPSVSMTLFALEPASGRIVLHVSALAPHTAHMQADPRVSLMVVIPSSAGTPETARARVSLQGHARFLEPGTDDWQRCRAAYVARFPEVDGLPAELDYAFVALAVRVARHTSGFGTTRSVSESGLMPLLSDAE